MKNYMKPEATIIILNENTSLMAGSDLGISNNPMDNIDNNNVQLSRMYNDWEEEEDY